MSVIAASRGLVLRKVDRADIVADGSAERLRMLRSLSAAELVVIWRREPAFELPSDAPDRHARMAEARSLLAVGRAT